MLKLEEAQERILSALEGVGAESVDLLAAHGRVLAESVKATRVLPAFDNSAMDGYAVRAADTEGATDDAAVSLEVVEVIPAGATPTKTLGPGQAARIFTGAVMPEGADAVVMQGPVKEAKDASGGVKKTLAAWAIRLVR